jgi:uncharacterized protein (TIGR03435 family)
MRRRYHSASRRLALSYVLFALIPLPTALAIPEPRPPAQPADSEFTAVSVKLVPQTAPGPNRVVKTPGRVRYTQAYIWQIITRAFQVQLDQIVAPSWVLATDNAPRYEVIGAFDPSTTDVQLAAMFRTLLEERFDLRHHATREERDVYEMLIAPGGPKLQNAEIPESVPTIPLGRPAIRSDRQGYPILPAGWPAGVGVSSTANMYLNLRVFSEFYPVPHITDLPDLGLMRFSFRMVTMPQLLRLLQHICGLPHAIDRTGLTGKYDIRLAFSRGGSAPAREAGDAADPAPNVFSALQKQLGLQLKRTRAAMDVMVIDRVRQMPTEN